MNYFCRVPMYQIWRYFDTVNMVNKANSATRYVHCIFTIGHNADCHFKTINPFSKFSIENGFFLVYKRLSPLTFLQ